MSVGFPVVDQVLDRSALRPLEHLHLVISLVQYPDPHLGRSHREIWEFPPGQHPRISVLLCCVVDPIVVRPSIRL